MFNDSLQPTRFKLITAVHLFLIKDDEVMLARRFNTGYEDGNYSVPAGHVDGNESAKAAMIREAREEVGVKVVPEDLEFAHVMHRLGDSERVDFFFIARHWQGKPSIKEPHKCDELRWVPMVRLPENTIPYIRQAIEHVHKGLKYSEMGFGKAV